jgi:hypothetical protein
MNVNSKLPHGSEMEAKVQSFANERIQAPIVSEYTQVSVTVGTQNELVEMMCQAIAWHVQAKTHRVIDVEGLQKELVTLFQGCLRLRVAYVNVEKRRDYNPKSIHPRNVAMPGIFLPYLAGIGEVVDTSAGVRYLPVLAEGTEQWTHANWEEWLANMNKLAAILKGTGVVYSEGLPRGTNGDVQVMTFEWVEDVLRHATNGVSPHKALLSSAFQFNLANGFAHAKARVSYIDIQQAKLATQQLVEFCLN